MNKELNFSAYLLPGIIILISALIRIWGIGTFSLSNDELSAVMRLNYPDFTSLVTNGIVATDPHPGGVQVFLYFWTKLFGTSPFAVRLPFVLSSSAALIFIYLTFRDWFGRQPALMSLALFSLMQFSIIQGQLARPYAVGILTVSVFIWAWTNILYHHSKRSLHLIAFIVSGALSCYTHYFAALLVGIVGIAGIYPSVKQNVFKLYILLGFTSVLLFAPHLGITMMQLGRGSLTSWITKPEGSFLFEHIFHLLNESYLMLALTSLFAIMGVFLISRKVVLRTTFSIFSLLFFITPIIVGYFYSEFFGSVLMDRVLYFSSPFFFGLIFSHFPVFDKNKFYGLLGLMIFAALFTTFFERQFFERNYTENFKALASHIEQERAEKGQAALMLFGNFNSTDYINYYLEDKIEFTMSSMDSDSSLGSYQRLIRNGYPSEFSLYWACKYHPIASIEYAKQLYGPAKGEALYYNSGYWHFGKSDISRDTLIYDVITSNDSLISEDEFYNIFSSSVEGLKGIEVLNVDAKFSVENAEEVHLVFSLVSKEGETIIWKGHSFKNFSIQNSGEIFQSIKIDPAYFNSDELSIYLWNPKKQKMMINDLILSSFADSHYPQLY